MNEPLTRNIKAVIFDVGGVLIRTADFSGREAWEMRLGLPAGGAEAIVLNSEMGYRAQRGEITTDILWSWVGKHLDLGSELSQFRQDFWRGDFVDQSLVTLLRKLQPRYTLAIISNATDSLTSTLTEFGLQDKFDLIVGSAYEGVMKPNPAIYERTLDRLGVIPQESVFIDDSLANIAGAQALGMKTIWFKPTLNLREELKQFGVKAD